MTMGGEDERERPGAMSVKRSDVQLHPLRLARKLAEVDCAG